MILRRWPDLESRGEKRRVPPELQHQKHWPGGDTSPRLDEKEEGGREGDKGNRMGQHGTAWEGDEGPLAVHDGWTNWIIAGRSKRYVLWFSE